PVEARELAHAAGQILAIALAGLHLLVQSGELAPEDGGLPFGHSQVRGHPMELIERPPGEPADLHEGVSLLGPLVVIGEDDPPLARGEGLALLEAEGAQAADRPDAAALVLAA